MKEIEKDAVVQESLKPVAADEEFEEPEDEELITKKVNVITFEDFMDID